MLSSHGIMNRSANVLRGYREAELAVPTTTGVYQAAASHNVQRVEIAGPLEVRLPALPASGSWSIAFRIISNGIDTPVFVPPAGSTLLWHGGAVPEISVVAGHVYQYNFSSDTLGSKVIGSLGFGQS